MPALSNTQFNVLWKCFHNRSVVVGLAKDNIWYAPTSTVRSLVKLGYLKEAGLRTRTITPKGTAAMKADEERWLMALEIRETRRREAARTPATER